MRKITILIIALMMIGTGLLTGCTSNPVNPPQFSIMSQIKREGYEGADRVGYVDITVKNTGGSGSKTISVIATQGSNYWTEEQSPFIESGQSTTLTFRYQQIAFWTADPWDFTVRVN